MKKDVPLCINFLTKKTPYKGLGADSEEKHEPVSDIDTAAVESLKVLDPKRPIREADISRFTRSPRQRGEGVRQSAPTPPRAGARGGRSGSAAPRAESAPSAPS